MAADIAPKVRFTWNISYDCNYRCSYCFFEGKWQEYKKRNIYLSPEEWMGHWRRVCERYGQVALVITGGEPLIYPGFIDLIKKLSRRCLHINVSSNASANLEEFVSQVDPGNVSISLSYQREFEKLESFVGKVKLARSRGFKGCLNLVAWPPFLERLKDDNKKLFEETGEEFKVIPFFGVYGNKEYPAAYSEEERGLVGITDGWFRKIKRKGSLCSAGCTAALIFPDGKVARCGQIGERLLLGNFLNEDFRLHDEPAVCEAEYCPCQEDSVEGDDMTGVKPAQADTAGNSAGASSRAIVSAKDLKAPTADIKPAHPRGKVKFAWDIHYKCNFRCPYCWFYKDWARLGKRSIYLSPGEWLEHWTKIRDKYGEARIDIVGGEPFIYPDFIELIKGLSRIHQIKITTNLSGDIERFAREIDPQRAELDLNFHVLFIDLETVVKKTLILKKAGFKCGICYLAYPPQMHKIKQVSRRFREEGINFALAAYWGEYNGKKYPAAYTEPEKEMMAPFLGDLDRVIYHLDAKSPKGRLCRAGFSYADIQADGRVVRCAQLQEKSIGNITDADFKLFDGLLACESDSCPCNEYVNLVDEKQAEHKQEKDKEPTVITAAIERAAPAAEAAVLLPKLIRKVPPYRVHWNWELGLGCNYKCSYCHVWPKGVSEKNKVWDVKAWQDVWDEMFNKYWCCHVRFSGGEPTIYPGFFDIVSMLLKKHTVDITTNLSFDIKAFTSKVRPGGISISASFHPEYNQIGPFLDKVIFLHNNGYPSTIAYVAYPPHLKQIEETKAYVEKNRILFKIIPYQGEFQGRKYPQSYTPQEKRIIEGLSVSSEDSHLNDLNSRWYDWNVKREEAKKDKKGSLCRMGQMYAKIFPDGRVARCCALDKDGNPLGVMGHITDLNLKLLDEPAPCLVEQCPCFKSMLVGAEEDKWLPLWEALEHPVYKTDYIKQAAVLPRQDNTPVLSAVSVSAADTRTQVLREKTVMDRKAIEPHRVFYTWDIHYACNYRCEYCFFSKRWDEVAKENRYPPLDDLKRVWGGLFADYGAGHIHFSGGEPFTYPHFMDLVAHLIQEYTVEFDTNLSFDLAEFIAKIRPGKVKFATAFHPSFANIDAYFRKVELLRKEGFDMGVNYVAYPKQLERMKEYKSLFEKNNISFTIMPFRGEYEARAYPAGYTEQEKDLIRACDTNLTISAKMLEWYGGNKFSRQGKVCRMGQMYTKIHPNGDAYRCCYIQDKNRLGNIIEGTFALLDEAKPCVNPECSCWTAMVIGQEEQWMSHWALPKDNGP